MAAATSRAAAPTTSAGTYRPHLDGLRALAVYLVVAFHAGVYRLNGGFIGVDVFFVLSGYLVTQLLLRDLTGAGSIRLMRFYARRARRLLPAAATVLVATAVVQARLAPPAEWDAARDGIRAASLYVANWFLISQSADYFAADVTTSPVLHFWSLAVEEQFYVVWPLLLLGLHRLARRARHPRRALQLAVAGAAAASLAAALVVASGDLDRAYYGSDTRAYQLLAGALLALTPGVVGRVRSRIPAGAGTAATLGILGLLALTASWVVDVGAIERGVLATVLTVGLIVVLDSDRGGWGARLLSLPPVVYLGRISYGTYLWHWLVILTVRRELELGTNATAVTAVVVGTALASLSYELLEHPIRTLRGLDRRPGPVIVVGLATSLLVGLVVTPWVLDAERRTSATAVTGSEDASTGVEPDAAPDWETAQRDIPDMPDCTAATPERCVVVDGDGARILLVGDSHARMLIPTFRELATRDGLELAAAVLPRCPWVQGIRYINIGQECFDAQDDWYGPILDAVDPDVVVLAHRAASDPASPVSIAVAGDDAWLEPGTEAYDTEFTRRTRALVDRLRERGARVVIVEPLPITSREDDPLACLSEGATVEACRFVAHRGVLVEETAARQAADADDGVWSLDLDRAACPYLPICDPVVDGLIVRRDNTHLTGRFARTLADPVGEWARANGVWP